MLKNLLVTLPLWIWVHYIPTGYGKGYPPKIFTNPNDTSDSDVEFLASHFKPASDWDEDPIDLTQMDDASKQDKNPQPYDRSDDENTNGIAKAQLQATPRQPPPGWVSWRKEKSLPVPNKDKPTPQEGSAEVAKNKISNDAQKLTIEEARSIVGGRVSWHRLEN